MNTKKKNTGFSLTEILIAVAIIGILATVAMPSYTAYMKRAKATEIVMLYSTIKLHMASYHIETGSFPSGGSQNDRNLAIGLGASTSYETDTIESAWVGSGGGNLTEGSAQILIKYKDGNLRDPPNNSGGKFVATVKVVNGRYVWTCNDKTSNANSLSDMNYDYLPKECHN